MISLSLNEIEVTLRKAAIGVGLPLGLAEDAALATTWLVARGLPGLDLCHAALRHTEDHGPTVLSMEEGQGCLIVKNPTSALWFGPAAVDHICLQAKLNGLAEIRADWVDCPLLCFAMLAVAAAEFDLSITVAWKDANQAGAIAFCRGDEIRFSGAPPVSPGPLLMSLAAPPTTHQTLADDGMTAQLARSLSHGIGVDEQLWAKICQLAARTLVPASETSRLTGAGAGILDND